MPYFGNRFAKDDIHYAAVAVLPQADPHHEPHHTAPAFGNMTMGEAH